MKRISTLLFFAAALCAALVAQAANRLWNPTNEANVNLADGANWNPEFVFGTDNISDDELAINCTTGATLATDFSTKTFYVGKGSILQDGEFKQSASYDNGAKLDVSAGTLTATDTLWVGGGFSDRYDSILNLSGTGKIVANYLKTGDCASNKNSGNLLPDGTKACYINIGAGTEVTVSNQTSLSTYSGGTTFVTIDGGTWNNGKTLTVGSGGNATFTLNSGTVNLSTNPDSGETMIGNGSKTGKLIVNGGQLNAKTLHIGRDGHVGEADFTSGISVISNSAWYDTLNIGWGWNSQGTMKVSGDADLTVWGKMVVGRSNKGGSAYFEMSGGSLNITNHDIYVAQDSESVGSMKMTGGNAIMNNFIVANRGAADVELSGGTLKTRSNVRIGNEAVYEEYDSETGAVTKHENAGVGTLTLKSGGTFEVGGTLYAGYNGTGTFTLDGGTLTTFGSITIANNANSTGTIHVVSGTLRGGNDLYVGMRGTGVLTIDDGGTAVCPYWCNFNRDSASTAEGSTINLNQGGTLNVGSIHASGSGRATFNWNGGVFLPHTTQNAEYVFEDVDKYDVNVLRHGAILDTNGKDRSINVALNGDGNFVLRGENNCWIKKAADLKRGVRVEGGSLSFEQGFATATTATTPVKEIYVAEGKSLDLKGNVEKPTIYVQSYTRNGVVQEPGEYDDYGATIIVISSGDTVATATWTGDAGDGDTANSDNWECYNADDVQIYDAVPAADSVVTVPFEDAALFAGFTAAEIIVVATGDISLNSVGADCDDYSYSGSIKASGNLKIANGQTSVLRKADAWYDPSDADTVTADGEGKVTAIANKGYRGAEMNAKAIDSSSVPVVSEEGKINGKTALVFNGERGFKADGTIPSAVDQPRYIFGVAKTVYVEHSGDRDGWKITKDENGNEISRTSTCNHDDTQFMLIDCRNGNEDGGRFYLRKNSINGYDLCPEMYAVKTDSTTGYLRASNRPNVWNSYSYAYRMILKDGNMSVIGWQDGNTSDQGGNTAYTSLTASSSGTVGVWYGEGADGHKTTDGNMIGEALVFVNELSNSETELVSNYLKYKWTTGTGATAYDGVTTLASLDLNGYTVDFDGAEVVITKVTGTGTITNFSKATIGGVTIDGTSGDAAVVKEGAVISQKWLTDNNKTAADLDSDAANTKYSVYQCYLAGISPTDAEAEFTFTDAELGADGKVTRFTLPAKPNGTPVVQYNTTSASSDSWSSEGLTTSIDDKTVTVTGTWPEWSSVLFYRVKITP